MNQNIVQLGIDVDDTCYHRSALDQCTGEVLSFQCRATLKGLVGPLAKVQGYFLWRCSVQAVLRSFGRGFLAAT